MVKQFRGPRIVVPEPQAINLWLREKIPNLYALENKANQQISVTDSDLWIMHDTSRATARRTDRDMRLYMRVEIKTRTKQVEAWQSQMDNDIDLLARTDWPTARTEGGQFQKGQRYFRQVLDPKDNALIRFYGTHVWQLEKDTPDNSEWMAWDAKPINVSQLVSLFAFDIHPDTLTEMDFSDPMHKPRIQDTLPGMG